MRLISGVTVICSCLLTLCQTQRPGHGYNQQQEYYNRPKVYYQSSTNKNVLLNSSFNDYYKQTTRKNAYPYNSFQGSYGFYRQSTTPANPYNTKFKTRGFTHSYGQPNSINRSFSNRKFISSAPVFYNSASPISTKQYSTSTDNVNYGIKDTLTYTYNKRSLQDDRSSKRRISKADAENSKFVGAENQEDDEDARTVHLKRRKFHRRFGLHSANPCFPYGRSASNDVTPPPNEQGRFLWDVNVYNVYPGCGGYRGYGSLGAGLGGGLLSDHIGPTYYPPGTGLANFLSLFAPGILQNSLAATTRPQLFNDALQSSNDDLQNDDLQNDDLEHDPNVDPNSVPVPDTLPARRPIRVYYDSAGAPSITPAQLVGGISTTVNGIIQQLTGNVQPVYG